MDNNLVGKNIQGRYYVVKELGRGGVGVTFLAQDRQCFDSQCVVKQLKPKNANSQTLSVARRLFNREAEIMNRLGHCDRIPRLLAYFEQDNEFFLVQELIEGHDLSQEILPGQPWSEAETLALLQGTLEVLSIVQQHSVIHRDLKPSNLMRRTQDNQIILIDFGSVKQVSTQIIDAAGGVKHTVAVGTKSYMPMEQMMGRPGFHSDIYALGIIAIQALTGVNPREFAIDDDGEIIWRNRLDRHTNYQPRLLDLLDRMVRYRYQDRYTSAGAVLADLQELDAAQNDNKDTVILSNNQAKAKDSATPISVATSAVKRETELVNSQSLPELDSRGLAATVVTKKPQAYSAPATVKQAQSPKGGKGKALSLIAVAIALVAGIGAWFALQQRNKQPKIELSAYENLSQGFRVNYPQSWSKQNRDDFLATGAIFFSPLLNDADKFKEKVSVLVENLPSDLSLSNYTEQSLAEIKQLSDPDIEQAQAITFGTNEGRQITYRGEENGRPVQRMQVWSLSGDRAYVLTYTAVPEDYHRYLPTVEKMIESFETIQ